MLEGWWVGEGWLVALRNARVLERVGGLEGGVRGGRWSVVELECLLIGVLGGWSLGVLECRSANAFARCSVGVRVSSCEFVGVHVSACECL